MKLVIGLAIALVVGLVVVPPADAQDAQRGQGFRGGRGGGHASGRGPGTHGQGMRGQGTHGQGMRGQGMRAAGDDGRHAADRDVFHYLLSNHEQIRRTVKELPNGVETLTESDDPQIAAKIKEHVSSMEHRVENSLPIRMRDPLFAELFRHSDKIKMTHADTEKGVKVTETSNDAHVVKLIHAHAKVVSGFVQRGFAEAAKNHPVPSDGK